MMQLLLLSLALACAYAQVPTPCRAPFQFESRVFRKQHNSNTSMLSKMSYDANNQRVRFIDEFFEADGSRHFYDVIEVYSEDKRYVYNLNLKNCTVESMQGRVFRHFEVPNNASFLGEAVVGTKGISHGGVDVVMWQGTIGDNDHYMGVWTLDGCVPVDDYFESRRFGMSHTRFFDVNVGISDPNIFIPPQACLM